MINFKNFLTEVEEERENIEANLSYFSRKLAWKLTQVPNDLHTKYSDIYNTIKYRSKKKKLPALRFLEPKLK